MEDIDEYEDVYLVVREHNIEGSTVDILGAYRTFAQAWSVAQSECADGDNGRFPVRVQAWNFGATHFERSEGAKPV